MVTIATGARIEAVKVLHPMRQSLYDLRSLICWNTAQVRRIDAIAIQVDDLINEVMREREPKGGEQ